MIRLPLAALSCVAAARPAAAHVAMEPPEAAPHADVRAALHLPHGCGDAATTRITVRLPEGVTAARPMPKPGETGAPQDGARDASHIDRLAVH
jgi:uncharacterized protein YcnI